MTDTRAAGITIGYGLNPGSRYRTLYISPNGFFRNTLITPIFYHFRLGFSFESNEKEKHIITIPNLGLGIDIEM
jgi:hypothetical protein